MNYINFVDENLLNLLFYQGQKTVLSLISGEWFGKKTHESLFVSLIRTRAILYVFQLFFKPITKKNFFKCTYVFWVLKWCKLITFILVIFNSFKKKIAKYWPDHNDTKRNGNITIRCQTERIYAEHVIRHLRVHTSMVRYEKILFV